MENLTSEALSSVNSENEWFLANKVMILEYFRRVILSKPACSVRLCKNTKPNSLWAENKNTKKSTNFLIKMWYDWTKVTLKDRVFRKKYNFQKTVWKRVSPSINARKGFGQKVAFLHKKWCFWQHLKKSHCTGTFSFREVHDFCSFLREQRPTKLSQTDCFWHILYNPMPASSEEMCGDPFGHNQLLLLLVNL